MNCRYCGRVLKEWRVLSETERVKITEADCECGVTTTVTGEWREMNDPFGRALFLAESSTDDNIAIKRE